MEWRATIVETRDHKIIEEPYRLSLEFEQMEKSTKRQSDGGKMWDVETALDN
jgi:hypothetical protein